MSFGWIGGVGAGASFLTRLPVYGQKAPAPSAMRWASAHFALIGLVLGTLQGLLSLALSPLGSVAAATLAVAAGIWVTGALHEDGLCDTADALGGSFDRQRIAEILKDSRIGAYGATALVLALVLRVCLVSRLGASLPAAWALSAGLSRAAMTGLLAALPYDAARPGARSGAAAVAGPASVLTAGLWCAGAAVAAACFGGVSAARSCAAAALTLALSVACGRTFLRRFGGLAGDFLGAAQQVCELGCLAVFAWSSGP